MTFTLAEMFPNARDADPGLFPNQDVARTYLENARWPNGVVCPHCSCQRITFRKGGFYRCNGCQIDFTVRTGTIFERSHVPLHKWISAIHQVLTKDTKIVSVKLADELNVTQKTAWKMLHRIQCIVDIGDTRTLKRIIPRSKFIKIYPNTKLTDRVCTISPMVSACRLLRERTGIDVDKFIHTYGADREDAVQEIWMTVLENNLGLQIDAEQIKDAVKRSRAGALDRWKTISMYAPIRGTDNLQLIDTLQKENE
jgi:transposase-like protein